MPAPIVRAKEIRNLLEREFDMINVFLLAEFSAQLAPDFHAVLIWDGAGFHTAGTLATPANVTLITLPPYSPELNPIENLWHYLRSHYWTGRTARTTTETRSRKRPSRAYSRWGLMRN